MARRGRSLSLGPSGLASGVDTNAIVDQLTAIDRRGTTRITYRQSNVTGVQNSLRVTETVAGDAAAEA